MVLVIESSSAIGHRPLIPALVSQGHEFQASLLIRASSRLARATQYTGEPCLTKTTTITTTNKYTNFMQVWKLTMPRAYTQQAISLLLPIPIHVHTSDFQLLLQD